MADFNALYRAANANLSQSAHERRAADKLAAEQRRERERHYALIEKELKRQDRKHLRDLKAELKDITKECNRLDRKMRSKHGLTAEEHGAYEELDAMRWDLIRNIDKVQR